jgi:hypothetical protein
VQRLLLLLLLSGLLEHGRRHPLPADATQHAPPQRLRLQLWLHLHLRLWLRRLYRLRRLRQDEPLLQRLYWRCVRISHRVLHTAHARARSRCRRRRRELKERGPREGQRLLRLRDRLEASEEAPEEVALAPGLRWRRRVRQRRRGQLGLGRERVGHEAPVRARDRRREDGVCECGRCERLV